MEQPISRSELRSASPTPAPSSDDEALHRLRKLDSLQFTTRDVNMPDAHPEKAAEDDDEEVAFRLFASTASRSERTKTEPAAAVQKIRLRSPSLDPAQAGFIQPRRPNSYYMTGPQTRESRSTFEAAAISAEQLLALSRQPRPGSSYPWKVLHIPSTQIPRKVRKQVLQPTSFERLGNTEAPKKHRRKGKQTRIRIRMKLAKGKQREEAKRKAAEEAEAAEKEKRTKRNREKKVKKKAREKAKKAAAGGGEAIAPYDDSGSGDD